MAMTMTAETTASSVGSAAAGKYLTFRLHQEYYGIGVLKIREIIRLQNITPVPQTPAYVKGVLNLRGKIIPVIDLRIKFGLPQVDTEQTCIIVVQVTLPSRSTIQMGLVVDGVEEVLNITASEIEPTPDFGTSLDTEYLLGMAKVKGIVKALLDIDRVVSSDTLTAITNAPVAAAS